MDTQGTVLSIERFSLHDGPGVRTTVFLKGCPLDCIWCHNPESKSFQPQIGLIAERCTLCSRCVSVCPAGCHTIDGEEHVFNRENCQLCGACVAACFSGALSEIGKTMSSDQVMAEVAKDLHFYKNSNGGLTISGGEPMAQFSFTKDLLVKAKQLGIHTCLETCGYTDWELLAQITPYVDLWLWDFKESDPERHQRFTGKKNARIMQNLDSLASSKSSIILRCPLIPGYNDRPEHLRKIGELAERYSSVKAINLMPFHSYGEYKHRQIGISNPLEDLQTAQRDAVVAWVNTINRYTSKLEVPDIIDDEPITD